MILVDKFDKWMKEEKKLDVRVEQFDEDTPRQCQFG